VETITKLTFLDRVSGQDVELTITAGAGHVGLDVAVRGHPALQLALPTDECEILIDALRRALDLMRGVR
jgi:hypothetical protein